MHRCVHGFFLPPPFSDDDDDVSLRDMWVRDIIGHYGDPASGILSMRGKWRGVGVKYLSWDFS